MKRVFLAIAGLLIVAVMCILSLFDQITNTKYLLNLTDNMQATYDEQDWDECLRLTRNFVEEFEEHTRTFPFYMRHEDINGISEIVVALPIYLETGDTQHYPAELKKCRDQLEKVCRNEIPLPENIL